MVSGAADAKYRLVREPLDGQREMNVVAKIVWGKGSCCGDECLDTAIDVSVGVGGYGEGWEARSRGVISTRSRG